MNDSIKLMKRADTFQVIFYFLLGCIFLIIFFFACTVSENPNIGKKIVLIFTLGCFCMSIKHSGVLAK